MQSAFESLGREDCSPGMKPAQELPLPDPNDGNDYYQYITYVL